MPFFIFLELSPREFLFPAILLSRRHSSADMPLGFVVFQNSPNLPVQLGIYTAQTLGNVFMHRTLADAELFGGFPHGGFVFQNIIAKLYGPFFHDALQTDPPTTVLFHLYVGKVGCRTSSSENELGNERIIFLPPILPCTSSVDSAFQIFI